MAMALLFPDSRPRVGPEDVQRHSVLGRCMAIALRRLGGVELYGAEVLGTDEAVLVGADQADGCAMVTVERTAIEMLGHEHVLDQGVRHRHDRPIAVETAEDDVRDPGVRLQRLDDRAVEGFERDALPVQVGGGPPGYAVKVGGELSTGQPPRARSAGSSTTWPRRRLR